VIRIVFYTLIGAKVMFNQPTIIIVI